MSASRAVWRLPDSEFDQLLQEPRLVAHKLDRRLTTGEAPTNELYLDSAWYAIHCALVTDDDGGRGTTDFLLRGGTELGDFDEDYGPPRGFRSDEVALIAAALDRIPADELRRRFWADSMPSGGAHPETSPLDLEEYDAIEYALGYYEALRDFILAAAKDGQALVLRSG